MKKLISLLFISVCFCNCSEKKEIIDFVTLNETEFNAKPFQLPHGKVFEQAKRSHDSCMGFTFDANAMLIQKKDTLFIGSIIEKQSLKIVDSLHALGLTEDQLISEFNVLTNPCYEKKVLHLPLKTLLGENFILQLPDADKALVKEINDAISTSDDAEVQTGSWVYLDMKNALKKILDTTKSPEGLRYRKNLLDTANMVLMAMESITDISFIVNTKKDISKPLEALLQGKPHALLPNSKFGIQLFYLSNRKLQISLNGFFPMAGQFMKAELK